MVVEFQDCFSIEEVPNSIGLEHEYARITNDGKFYCYRNLVQPPCECLQCLQQFRKASDQSVKLYAYSAALSYDEAEKMATGLLQSMPENILYLRHQCSVNGDLILKRWKKSSKKRSSYLLAADPDLYPHQWGDAHFLRDYVKKIQEEEASGEYTADLTQGSVRLAFRNACLLPHLNREALETNPAKFLSLLYNRIHYTPDQWAAYDNFLLVKPWQIGALKTVYNSNCVMIYGKHYGRLTRWNEKDSHAWRIIGFPRAILVLEAQEKLLSFLRGVVETLVSGPSGNEAIGTSDAFTKSLAIGLRLSNETSGAAEFASTYLNQPYCPPPIWDVNSLMSIAQSRMNLHSDHLWLLQTDPAYIRRYVNIILAGEWDEILTKRQKDDFSASQIYRDAVTFWSWVGIVEEVKLLQKLHSKIAEDVRMYPQFEEAYSRALASIGAILETHINRRAKQIDIIFPTRPGFRHKYKFVNISQGRTSGVWKERKEFQPYAELFFADRLHWCLSLLANPSLDPMEGHISKYFPWHNYTMIFAALDEHLGQCRKSGRKDDIARLDEVLYSEVSDISAMHEILSRIRLYYPSSTNFEHRENTKDGTSKGWRYINKHFFAQDPLRSLGDEIPQSEDGKQKYAAENHLRKLLNEFLAVPRPTGSRMRQTWLEEDTSQRAALSRLWAGMRARHLQTLKRLSIDQKDIDTDLQDLSADSDPNYIEILEREREDILERIRVSQMEREIKLGTFAELSFGGWWAGEASPKDELPKTKTKVKTRAEVDQQEFLEDSPHALLPQEIGGQQQAIQASMSKSSFGIFRSMFPGRDSEEAPQKSIKWDTFVLAMAEPDVGFVARHSAGGSAVQFEPNEHSKWAGMGKIVFHKPHPVPVIDPVMLLSMVLLSLLLVAVLFYLGTRPGNARSIGATIEAVNWKPLVKLVFPPPIEKKIKTVLAEKYGHPVGPNHQAIAHQRPLKSGVTPLGQGPFLGALAKKENEALIRYQRTRFEGH
ncbi:hypothetical protein LSUE1_G004822 [Lachnellula suecica]|uniref:Uncharacterized protein n=1 Tax=Lachnellula suecica TaxID=602035 RepID=A0A8T9C7G0_9HELO|nr:hypothetical protein LSUE1_G004822 [Lachnellula suecica]